MSNQIIRPPGGTLPPDSPGYIARKSDDELLQLCLNNIFAYVLTARQMGKSSLMERTKQTLRQQDCVTATVDLSLIGSTDDAGQWYFGVIQSICDELAEKHKWKFEAQQWWQEHDYLSLSQRMIVFLDQVILTQFSQKFIIFVDEIDYTKGKSFTDDFYAAIRSVHNMRSIKQAFQRLSFVLLGVAIPSELISDPDRTPFNVGQAVVLTDFTYDEARPLLAELQLPSSEAGQILDWVLDWTGGHPYLTQRLFYEIARQQAHPKSETEFAKFCGGIFLNRDVTDKDTHLMWLETWLINSENRGVDSETVLKIYEEILLGSAPVFDAEDSLAHAYLKLSGIVRRQDNALVVRNRIYRERFNREWLYRQLRIVRERKAKPELPAVENIPTPSLPSNNKTVASPAPSPVASPTLSPPVTYMRQTPSSVPSEPAQPVTQYKRDYRSNWPEWMQQLPRTNFGSGPNYDFQLIDRQRLAETLRDTDPEVVQRINADLNFLEAETLRLFRERDYAAKESQNRYRLYRIYFLLLPALAALMGILQALAFRTNVNIVPIFSFALTVVMLMTTYLSTISGRESFIALWLTNRGRAEHLRREYFRYLLNMPPYDTVEGYQRQILLSKRAAEINRGLSPDSDAS